MVKILSIGAAVQDVFLSHSDEFKAVCKNPHECFLELTLGSKADVNKIDFTTGGGATNAAVTFARQGLEAAFMGSVGDDPAAQAVLNDLDKEGVDTTHVHVSKRYNTGYSVLLLAPNGERTILTYRGASTHYTLNDFDFSQTDADWLYISSMSGKMDILDQVFAEAKQQGMKIMFNPGKDELKQADKLRALLDDVDVLLVNRDEMKLVVEGEDIEELVRHGLHLVPTVIVTDGPDGVVASDGSVLVRAGMYEDVKVVDRTGAGDAFGSGFLSQYAQGKSLKDSVVFASANSTSVVTKIGAKTAILHKDVTLHDMPVHERKL
ncbi:MAG TPA: carbohydrate kinase family protein [Patescibacteria group bacterium]|jgi:sugar/nucleoside kinase (ribokinase family)|nr:carbohydrate kinase family protein [Patescibacteria group bacterium]